MSRYENIILLFEVPIYILVIIRGGHVGGQTKYFFFIPIRQIHAHMINERVVRALIDQPVF